jgi:UDP-N-acetylglucosamine 1-carboxyvinyltransferase
LEKFIINGQIPLRGEVSISGAKNSAVALISAALLIDGKCRIENLPDIGDVKILIDMLSMLGAKVSWEDDTTLLIDASEVNSYIADYDSVKNMRASYYLLGALLGRFKQAEVAFPGGCDFGYRPIDQHIKGFEAMGAKVKIEHGIVKVKAEKLIASQIYLDVVSVGATINLILAAVLAEGTTILENCAKEPHIVDLASFLNAMGANIKGAGTDIIKIKGVKRLEGGSTYSIIPDQIETGTFMIAAAASKGDVTVKNIIPKHMESLTAKLIEMNIKVIEGDDWLRVYYDGPFTKVSIKTLPHPGFPTDLHPQIAVLLSMANGTSSITESIWPLRFQYADEMKRMGCGIRVESGIAFIDGNTVLSGAQVRASDLRAGAALVIAAIAAQGTTEIMNLKYIDRGYEKIEEKFRELGADIIRVKNVS